MDTPLHVAVENDSVRMITILIKNGADINKKNNFEETPKSVAKRRKNERVLHVFNSDVLKFNLNKANKSKKKYNYKATKNDVVAEEMTKERNEERKRKEEEERNKEEQEGCLIQ